MSFLRDVDEKYVPRMAEALDRLAKKFPKGPEPSGPLPVILRLRRLDDRWTSAGPLALLREVPQLGAVLIGALVLASSVTVAGRTRPATEARPGTGVEQPAEEDEVVVEGTLGPDIGESVPEYLTGSKARLRKLAGEDADGMVVAVVMLDGYHTPEAVRDLLGPLQARQVFYRPPVKTGVVRTAAVEDLVGDTRRAFRRYAVARNAAARELRKVAATIEGDPEQKREHERDAAGYEVEVKLLRGDCECVFAVVVRAQVRMLADALNLSDVRTIDASAVGARIENLTFTALLPEETVTVTGGNQEM